MTYDITKLDIDEFKTLLSYANAKQRQEYISFILREGVSQAKTKMNTVLVSVFEDVLRFIPEQNKSTRIGYLNKFADLAVAARKFDVAERFCEYVLAEEPSDDKAHFAKLKARLKCSSTDELMHCRTPIDRTQEFNEILSLAADTDYYIDLVAKQQETWKNDDDAVEREKRLKEEKRLAAEKAEREKAQREKEMREAEERRKKEEAAEQAREAARAAAKRRIKNIKNFFLFLVALAFITPAAYLLLRAAAPQKFEYNFLSFLGAHSNSAMTNIRAGFIVGPYVFFFILGVVVDNRLASTKSAIAVLGVYSAAALGVMSSKMDLFASLNNFNIVLEIIAYAIVPILVKQAADVLDEDVIFIDVGEIVTFCLFALVGYGTMIILTLLNAALGYFAYGIIAMLILGFIAYSDEIFEDYLYVMGGGLLGLAALFIVVGLLVALVISYWDDMGGLAVVAGIFQGAIMLVFMFSWAIPLFALIGGGFWGIEFIAEVLSTLTENAISAGFVMQIGPVINVFAYIGAVLCVIGAIKEG